MLGVDTKRYLGVFVAILLVLGILAVVETVTMFPRFGNPEACQGLITSTVRGWGSNQTNKDSSVHTLENGETVTVAEGPENSGETVSVPDVQENKQCLDSHWIFKQAWYNMGTRKLLTTNHPTIRVNNGPEIREMDLVLQGISDVVILSKRRKPTPDDMVALVTEGLGSLKNDSNPNRALRVWIGTVGKCDFYKAWIRFPQHAGGYVMISTMEGENYGWWGTQVGDLTRWGFAENHISRECTKVEDFYNKYVGILDDPKLIGWFFVQFNYIEHDKLLALPLGFQDPYGAERATKEPSEKLLWWWKNARNTSLLPTRRTNLLEFNFNPQLEIRATILDKVNKSFHGELHRDKDLSWIISAFNSKFNLCPMGIGMDTYRVIESLAFGMIPIILTTPMDRSYAKLPILIVESFSDVTPELLEKEYVKLCNRVDYDFRRLTLEYWVELIKSVSDYGTDVLRKLHPIAYPNWERQIRKPGSRYNEQWKYLKIGYR